MVGLNVRIKRRRSRLAIQQGYKCFYCHCKMTKVLNSSKQCTLEHLFTIGDPLRISKNALRYTVAACRECNTERNNTTLWSEFYISKKIFREYNKWNQENT